MFNQVARVRDSYTNASIAQLAEHLLRKEKVTSSILVGGFCCSHGLVGYDARLTRERSRVRASVRIFNFFFNMRFHPSQRPNMHSQSTQIKRTDAHTTPCHPPNVHKISRFGVFFFWLQGVLDMLGTFIWFDHGEWKPREWKCRIQVFSKLVESARNTPWDRFGGKSWTKTLSDPHFGPKRDAPILKNKQNWFWGLTGIKK